MVYTSAQEYFCGSYMGTPVDPRRVSMREAKPIGLRVQDIV